MQQTIQQSQAYLIIQRGTRWTDILRLQANQVVTIGRSSDNQVVVADDRISRRHAEVSRQDGGWHVADLGSRNGTQVDGQSISQPHLLLGGEVVTVGNCQMTFTYKLSEAFPGANPIPRDQQVTCDGGQAPAIVGRLANSQWSAELPAGIADKSTTGDKWSFFYRLIHELVRCNTADEAAGQALDLLLDELKISAGGVVLLDRLNSSSADDSEPADAVRPATRAARVNPSKLDNSSVALLPDTPYRMAVLAARQAFGSTYHRISDFLIRTVLREKQAILARNVQDDGQLTLARNSGQQATTSILCVPIRLRGNGDNDPVIGLLHVYTQVNERMLSNVDLDLAVGVADNLAIALSRLQENQQVAAQLDASRRKAELLEQQLKSDSEMIGTSQAIAQVKLSIQRAAPTSATVLILGESGVGKELVARSIHINSRRREGPMVCLNCAALAPTLLESELFGHEKGAFTGATERKIGKFEAAHRGTLLLDEIGEMPIELQAKFLRVLEGHPFERLGGSTPIQTDVRVLAATNRDLTEAVNNKLFRSDLYYRLRVIEIFVPPLRERLEDVPALVSHFLNQLSIHSNRRLLGIEPAAMELLVRHRWPGNIRELRNAIERAVVLGLDSTIGKDDLGLQAIDPRIGATAQAAIGSSGASSSLAELEQSHILATLKSVDGNKSKAAQLLGIERSTLDRKLKRFSTSD